MNLTELIKTALKALSANKPRTALTMLGIIIGIASVISMLSIGAGAQASVQASITALGSNILTITAGSQSTGLVQGGAGTAQSLTNEDATAIADKNQIQNAVAVSPETSRNEQILGGGNNTNTAVTGVVPDYAIAHNYEIDSGSFITSDQVASLAKVAVLGPDTASALFGEDSPIGKTITINKVIFRVIGVTVAKGSTGFNSPDDAVFVPLSTAQKILFGQTNLRDIVVQAQDADSLTQLQDDITQLLLNRHKISDPTQADFTIRNSADTLASLSSITGVFTTLLASIASISLVVGGIGIMNIMIVTVTERTKEIGLRKAIGATNNIILTQFLVEAVVLTLIGGLLGVAVGYLISQIITSTGTVTTLVTPISVILSTVVSVLVGVIFGLYPAIKASKLRPIEALRFE